MMCNQCLEPSMEQENTELYINTATWDLIFISNELCSNCGHSCVEVEYWDSDGEAE